MFASFIAASLVIVSHKEVFYLNHNNCVAYILVWRIWLIKLYTIRVLLVIKHWNFRLTQLLKSSNVIITVNWQSEYNYTRKTTRYYDQIIVTTALSQNSRS